MVAIPVDEMNPSVAAVVRRLECGKHPGVVVRRSLGALGVGHAEPVPDERADSKDASREPAGTDGFVESADSVRSQQPEHDVFHTDTAR